MCGGGIANTIAGGALSYVANSHMFMGIVKIGALTVATTDQIPSLTGYTTLASPAFTGNATLGGENTLTQAINIIPSYKSVGRYVEIGCGCQCFLIRVSF